MLTYFKGVTVSWAKSPIRWVGAILQLHWSIWPSYFDCTLGNNTV